MLATVAAATRDLRARSPAGLKLADAGAFLHQDRHRKLANAAAFFGTVAVLLAISQLAFGEMNEKPGGY